MKSYPILSSTIVVLIYLSKNIIYKYLENEKAFITTLEESLNNITL